MTRTSIRLAFSFLGSSLLVGSLVAGCGGDGGKKYPDATVDLDAHADTTTKDTGGDAADAGVVPPTVAKDSKLIVNGNIELIGSGSDTCTNQVPPVGDRWCGFSRLSTSLTSNELWVVNVTKVAAGVTVQCAASVADPNCIRLSTGLYQDPNSGFRVHGFDGDTLTYSEDPSQSQNGFIGSILAWRPGWKKPHELTSGKGMVCNGNAKTNAAICLENPVADSTGMFVHTAELHAGFLSDTDGPLPLVDTVILHGANDASGVQKWGARLSPDGKSIAWSTRTTDQGTEDLKWQNVGDDASRVAVASDVNTWSVSSDLKKWYWLKSFNYDQNGAPSGTLQSAVYPSATGGPTTIAASIGDYTEAGTSLYVRSKVTADVGALLLVPNRDAPATVQMVDDGVAFVFEATPDGKNAIYTKNIQLLGTNLFLFDAYVAGAANTMPCALTKTATAFVPPTFLSGGSLVAWGRFNTITQEIEGVSTTIPGCATRKFASDFFGMTAAGDEGLIYLDTLDPDPNVFEATLRYGKVAGGQLPAPGVVIQARAGLEYASLLPALDAVLYTITSNTNVDGLYLNATLPFMTVPTVDGGTGGTDATTPTDSGTDVGSTDAGSSDGAAADTGAADAQSGG